jgi:hypothetical protein
MARRMRGRNDGQARQIFGDLIDMPADIAITDNEITMAILAPRPSFRGGTTRPSGYIE